MALPVVWSLQISRDRSITSKGYMVEIHMHSKVDKKKPNCCGVVEHERQCLISMRGSGGLVYHTLKLVKFVCQHDTIQQLEQRLWLAQEYTKCDGPSAYLLHCSHYELTIRVRPIVDKRTRATLFICSSRRLPRYGVCDVLTGATIPLPPLDGVACLSSAPLHKTKRILPQVSHSEKSIVVTSHQQFQTHHNAIRRLTIYSSTALKLQSHVKRKLDQFTLIPQTKNNFTTTRSGGEFPAANQLENVGLSPK